MNLDAGLKVWQDAQQRVQGSQVEVIWEALDDALHEVLLGNGILAAHYLVHHPCQHPLLHNETCGSHQITSDARTLMYQRT